MIKNEKKFEKIICFLIGLVCVIVVAIVCLLPKGSGLTTTEKVQELVVLILVLIMAMISNAMALVALVLRKGNVQS